MWTEARTDLTPFLTVLTEIRDALRDAQDREDARVMMHMVKMTMPLLSQAEVELAAAAGLTRTDMAADVARTFLRAAQASLARGAVKEKP